jgi:hypothetical protein
LGKIVTGFVNTNLGHLQSISITFAPKAAQSSNALLCAVTLFYGEQACAIVTDSQCHPNLTFKSKVGAYPRVESVKDRLDAFFTNIVYYTIYA